MNDATGSFSIDVILAMPRRTYQVVVTVSQGSTARDALIKAVTEAGLNVARFGLAKHDAGLAVFGESVADDYLVVPGDRLEVLRPLQQDPKEWRRRRARAEQ